MTDDEISRLMLAPFVTGECAPPPAGARVLRLNARGGDMDFFTPYDMAVQQDFRPWALSLLRAGADVCAMLPGDTGYDAVLLAGRKQQDENRALLAAGLRRLAPGGLLLCAAPNDAGGKRLADDFRALGLRPGSLSKYHGRAVWAAAGSFDAETARAWEEAGAPCRRDFGGHMMWTQPGLFGWDGLDRGSGLLLAHIPADALRGAGADLGCGTGVLTADILRSQPGVADVLCVDADARAVEAARRNLDDARVRVEWRAVGVEPLDAGRRDWVVMNPPFHAGKTTTPQAGLAFIAAAADMLRPGGVLWMVANVHLPYEKQLAQSFARVEKIAEAQGFKIYRAVK
jgi:16S rRNA (guanine1207-N2)-methyltransferase